jgi:hypothetical protein
MMIYNNSNNTFGRMKFTLLTCISLLASLLHAAAMPITDLGNTQLPMITKVADSKQHVHGHHASMQHYSDHDVLENHCPEAENSCCLLVVLQSASIALSTIFFREELYASRPLNQPIFRPEALYRPPKFYPAFAG